MNRAELLDKLRELKPWLESQGVVDLRLFGSFARDEARDDSDVDLMCDATGCVGWNFFGVAAALAERLGRRVDLVEHDQLRPFAMKTALRDMIHV